MHLAERDTIYLFFFVNFLLNTLRLRVSKNETVPAENNGLITQKCKCKRMGIICICNMHNTGNWSRWLCGYPEQQHYCGLDKISPVALSVFALPTKTIPNKAIFNLPTTHKSDVLLNITVVLNNQLSE